MTLPGDRLERAKARPHLVEVAIRTALTDAIAWRIGGGNAPGADAFIAAALAAARSRLDAADSESGERSRTLAGVTRAASRFRASALCGRLMTVPSAQLLRLPGSTHGADVVVRDRKRRLHAIVLTARPGAFEAGQIAGVIAEATPLSLADCLMPLTVHVFSLATGLRRSFAREVGSAKVLAAAARVA